MTTTVEVTNMTLAAGTVFYTEAPDGTLELTGPMVYDTKVEVVACGEVWNVYTSNGVLIYVKAEEE